jgi:FkbM family methyltransferase
VLCVPKSPEEMNPLVFRARQLFYRAGGPWWRARVAEALGSKRFSRPALGGIDNALEPWLPETGVFFEAGAHDGFTQSNTYHLERHHGWTGVLVEAIPTLAEKATRRRRRAQVFNCALAADAKPGDTVTLRFGDLMSVDKDLPQSADHAAQGAHTAGAQSYEVEVEARTLSSVLDEAGSPRVDLMILDVEGRELDVLRGLDLERHAPRLLVIEMLEMEQQKPAFDELLADHYEAVDVITAWDVLYVRRDVLRVPVLQESRAHNAPS